MGSFRRMAGIISARTHGLVANQRAFRTIPSRLVDSGHKSRQTPVYFHRMRMSAPRFGSLSAMALGTCLFFQACNAADSQEAGAQNNGANPEVPEIWRADVGKELEKLLTRRENKALEVEGRELPSATLLRDFYQAKGYDALWLGEAPRRRAMRLLSGAKGYGLEPAHYLPEPRQELASPKDYARMELQLSDGLLRFGHDLAVGQFAPDSAALSWTPNERVPDLLAWLASSADSSAWYQGLRALQPDNPLYHALQQATARFILAYPLEDSTATVPTEKQDSIQAHALARDLLRLRGFLDSAGWASDSLSQLALRHFQRMHGLKDDGVIGSNTAMALGRSNADRYRSLAITLERWRWENDWTQPFAWVCLPGFELQIIDGDTAVHTHRVVVGTRSNQTPEITSTINVLVAYPYWHVPYSISTQEILPKTQNDPGYLSRNGYTVRDRSGAVVDAQAVDWNGVSAGNFPYLVRQNGGTSNALGLVKFLFPNTHSVYLHDTNAKRYFDSEIRSFSHGCVRLDRPMDFAAYLLARDTGSADMALVDRKIAERKEHKIALSPGLPVYLRHFTARADADGWPIFHLDLYGLDAAFEADRAREAAQMLANDAKRKLQLEALEAAAQSPDTLVPPTVESPSVSP
ncbi:MAG: L,D-transpeptidase family protein [Bacteroidetes bacterium]|nr:L,D-transpeptidase family protein [Bacteroidota bacterium]